LIACDTCPNRFHLECVEPPLLRAPRGRWSCTICKNKKKNTIKGNEEIITKQYTDGNVLRIYSSVITYEKKVSAFNVDEIIRQVDIKILLKKKLS